MSCAFVVQLFFRRMTIIYLPSTDSTNLEARRLIQSKSCNNHDVVQSGFQTLGRGQQGNSWYSLADENLLFSIVNFPEHFEVARFFELTQVASVAVVKYLFSRGIRAQIKWPNDILVNRKKIAGILIENTMMGNYISDSITGIGLNVNASVFPLGLQQKSTSMLLETSLEYSTSDELNRFMEFYSAAMRYDNFRLRRLYHKHLFAMNQKVCFRHGDIVKTAINAGVTDNGQIIMIMPDGTNQYFWFKEIEWLI